jgi:hypothetical protein
MGFNKASVVLRPKLTLSSIYIQLKEQRVSIESDLRLHMNNNDYTLDIIEADELIAVWRYKLSNRFTRSMDFSRVPQEWRYAVPPANSEDLMPCHISYRLKASHSYSRIEPAYEMSHCHRETNRWSSRAVPSLSELDAVGFAKRNVAPYISPILDTYTLSLVCKDLGLNGRAIPKVIKGRQYIVLSGYAGLRTYLPGTVYSVSNRKIIQMALGSLGVTEMVKSGAKLTICLTVPLAILEYFLTDQTTMSSLIGQVATDLAKIGISAIISTLAGLAIGSFATVAALPIIATIAVGVFTGIGLELIDKQYGLTDKLVQMIEQCSLDFSKNKEELEKSLSRPLQEAERKLIWRAYRFDISNPFQSVHGMR